MGKASLLITETEWKLKLQKLKRKLPVEAYMRLGPLLSKQHQRNAQRMFKTMARGDEIARIFEFFVRYEWIYECKNFKKLW